jgi:hypothetical protein
MAAVPGPRPDRPLPTPGITEDPARERDHEEEQQASPSEPAPSWEPEPYDPEREFAEPQAPAAVP